MEVPEVVFMNPDILQKCGNLTIRQGNRLKEVLDEFPVFQCLTISGESAGLAKVNSVGIAPFELIEEEMLSRDKDPNNRTIDGLDEDGALRVVSGGLDKTTLMTIIDFDVPELQP